MRIARVVGALLAAVCLGSSAEATPEIWAAFKGYYELKPDSAIFAAKCSNCHTKPPAHNAFGKAVSAELSAKQSDNLTPEILLKLESMTLPGDDWTVGAEIRAGLVPGSKRPEAGKALSLGSSTSRGGGQGPLLPTHSFHPALVHFPIALFLFGVALDLWGWWARKPEVRAAGFWNLAAGAASTAIVLPTGLAALVRMGFGFEGAALVHLIVAVSATLLMIAVVLWRRRGQLESKLYWALLLAAAALVGLAGHFGGQLVTG